MLEREGQRNDRADYKPHNPRHDRVASWTVVHVSRLPGPGYDGHMPDRSRRPRDPNQLGKLIVDIATGDVEDTPEDAGKNSAAVELGRKGGLKGGKARAESMTPEQRSEAAKRAARARWKPDA
jgi:hypothetical protein